MRIRVWPDVACDSALFVPAKILNANGVEDPLFHEVRDFAAGRVIEEKREMREAGVRVFPQCSRLAGQFRGRISKAVELLSQCNFEVAASRRCAQSDQSMIFSSESRCHR